MSIEGFPLLHAAVSLELHRALSVSSMPVACGIEEDAIQNAARRLRPDIISGQDWMLSLIGMAGGTVRVLDTEWPDSPLVVSDAPGRFLVSLPGEPVLSTRGRDWFLALAMAHIELHWPPKGGWGETARILYVPRIVKGLVLEARNEAITFAVELLMPEGEFRQAMEHPETAVEALGIQISPAVIKARARSLEIGD